MIKKPDLLLKAERLLQLIKLSGFSGVFIIKVSCNSGGIVGVKVAREVTEEI